MNTKTIFILLGFFAAAQPAAFAADDGHDHGDEGGHKESAAPKKNAAQPTPDEHDHAAEAAQKNPAKTGSKAAQKEAGHDEPAGDAELSAAQRQTAGIETSIVKSQPLAEQISAPGEVVVNAYGTTKVTTRIAGQVISRQVRLGDHVKSGQPLVTLSSVEMAEAQGTLLEAEAEWRRALLCSRACSQGWPQACLFRLRTCRSRA